MNAQDLKNSILQLAVQGKLVEQRPEEDTAKELLAKIKAEKEQLIKDKKIKKEKPLPEITDEEKPFEIPETWEWVRLINIVYNNGQCKPEDKFCYIDIGSIDNKNQRLSDEDKVIEAQEAPSRARKIVKYGDIIYSTVRPYLHNMCIIDRVFPYEPIASTGFAVLSCFSGIYNKFLFYYLLAPAFDNYVNSTENAKGVAYPAINDDRLYRAVIPVPPLAEQKRIVSKIEELLPYIEQYDKAYTKLETFNKKFPEDMKKSILQYAIRGRLVEQRPEEGNAEDLYKQIVEEKAKLIKEGKIKKEKPIDYVLNDDIPFEIPENWEWVRFASITINRDAERIPLSVSERSLLTKRYDYYGASGVIDKVDRYLFDEDLLLIGEDGANLLSRSTPIAFIARGKYWVNNHAHVIECPKGINIKYLMYCINSISLAKYVTGTAQPKMNQARMNGIWIPLPPLEEQKRIVARLEEILPYCNQLVK